MNFHSKKILILIIICNVIAGTGYYFLFRRIQSQTEAASFLASTLDVGQQKNSRLNQLRAAVKETEDNRQKLNSLLLSSDTEITFIDQVETLGKSAGLIMKTKSVSSVPGDTNTTKTFKMQTEASGSWNDVMYFLSQIENLPYNIHLETVSVHKDTGPQWNGTFDISVTELI